MTTCLTTIAVALLCTMPATAARQDTPASIKMDSLRAFTIKVSDRKGHPVKNYDMAFWFSSQPQVQKIGANGSSVATGLKPSDSLFVWTPSYSGKMAIAGLDSVELRIARSSLVPVLPQTMYSNGYQMISERSNTQPMSNLDVADDLSRYGYSDLASYLKGRVAGVNVVHVGSGYDVMIRGINSINISSSALIVVDGTAYSDFDSVNRMLSLHDVKSIDVLKDGAMYGARGANGVIIITTRSGGR